MQLGPFRFVIAAAIAVVPAVACAPATPTPTPEPTATASASASAAPTAAPTSTPTSTATSTAGGDAGDDASAAASGSDAGGADAAPVVAKTLFVREKRVACSGEGARKCLQVRDSASEPWKNQYAPIMGFTYEEGYAYELRVAPETVPNAPADAPTKKWRLVEIVSKKKK